MRCRSGRVRQETLRNLPGAWKGRGCSLLDLQIVTILIDPPAWSFRGRLWSHLVSDVSFDELHAFVDGLGIPRRAFQGDHYDIPQERYEQVLLAGAQETDSRSLVLRLRAAGLRRPKPRQLRGEYAD